MTIHNLLPPVRLIAPGGPVSAAIRAIRADEPASDYTRIRELRRAISDRIEADLALLDAIDGDPDFEPWLSSRDMIDQTGGYVGDGSDREDGDDNGIADDDGMWEQAERPLHRQALVAAAEASDRRAPRLRLISGGAA